MIHVYDDIISRLDDNNTEELLRTHSDDVGSRMPVLSSYSSDGSLDSTVILRCEGYLHDLGKVTPHFQRYVRDAYVEEKQLTYHARLGAFAVFHALGRMGASESDCLVGMLAVLKHHGRLPDAAEQLTKIVKAERNDDGYVVQQVDDINESAQNRAVADELLREGSNGSASWESFKTAVNDGTLFATIIELASESGHREGTEEPAPEQLPPKLYDRVLHHWSVLTLADKTSAAAIKDRDLRPSHLELTDLEEHIHTLREDLDDPPPLTPDTTTSSLPLDLTDETALNQLREGVRRLVKDNAEQFVSSSANVATLTLPTGLGKTFTGITAAYTIRNALDHTELSTETRPRVVYALPYTSIIEQTRDIFESEDILNADPYGLAFTVHHYLSDTVSYPKIEGEYDGDQTADSEGFFDPALLGESWRSGTTLTTFVQLFESLTAPTNANGLKLPSLTNSVIILDEPQTLPKPWWEAIRRLTTLLVERYDASIISMTATQPSLFTHVPEIETMSLLGGSDSDTPPLVDTCFEAVERVEYNVDESVHSFEAGGDDLLSIDAAADRLFGAATTPMNGSVTEDDEGSSVLSVCNTVASTQELTEAVSDRATAAGWTVTRIGEAYQEALQVCSPPVDDDDPSPSLRPDPDAVAEQTLYELGFRPLDGDDSVPLSKQQWRLRATTEPSTLYVGTFTSRLRSRDRRAIVTIANVLARAGVPFIFVSTQAVEAGVDISFARVYRDLAPLDSVVQAAGRCNRSFEWGHSAGQVTVWALAGPEGTSRPPATCVYKPKKLLSKVAAILGDRCRERDSAVLPESDLTRTAIPAFYDWIECQDLEDRTLVERIESCHAEQLQYASLIDDEYAKYDIIVAETAFERALLNTMVDSFASKDKHSRYDLLTAMADLRVSVPVSDIETIQSQVHRIDRKSFDAEGINVLACTVVSERSPYDLAAGGFIVTDDDGLAGRFTFH
ncbi:CRISPR-associated endonuclease Cas3'' [Halocatena pleomorpha]|uniref:CRISPR-associated endonuclease Cas3 n=1 Tax=Halocatena pleomorpha TaxID=1785090 RepID=A0A3P3R3S7_9EURY|nr:CRISPR-associated endonuclease Cas3'' [Halocatena pleomorpha]RRJ27529.1 CRISPR-associated endonuclease Cas3'' [Halocatena pleomorpha]